MSEEKAEYVTESTESRGKKQFRIFEYDGSYSIRVNGEKQVILHSKDEVIDWAFDRLNTRPEPDAPEATGGEWSYREGVPGNDWGAFVITLNGKAMAETLREEKAKAICQALSTPQQEAPTEAEEQVGNALLSAKGLIEKLYSLVSHNPAMGRATSITINELDNAIDALFSLQPSKGVWVSRESAEVLAKFLPDDCYTNTPVGNAFKELKQSLERNNGQ